MSLSRRQLFARLSAIALAPLAKWLPKEEAVIGVDVASGLDWSVNQIMTHDGWIPYSEFIRISAQYRGLPEMEQLFTMQSDFRVPVTFRLQEEA